MEQYIYLNNSATSFPKPPEVTQSVLSFLSQVPLYTSRNSSTAKKKFKRLCRQKLADFFNIPDPTHLSFTSGATESLNLALKGLALKNKHVLTTSIEHNSVLRILKTMEQEKQIRLTIVNCDAYGGVSPASIKKNLCPDTAAVVLNHCSNVTGTVNDLNKIGALLKEKKIPFIVDASQSAGLYSIDVQKMAVDVLAFTGHKALLGTQGIGGIYIKEGLEIRPLKIGGTGTSSNLLYQPTSRPMYYEAGTPNFLGITTLYEGLLFIEKTGMDFIRKKIQAQIYKIKTAFAHYPKIKMYHLPNTPSTILSFTIDEIDSSDIGYLLEKNFNIIVRTGLHCAPLIHQYIGTPVDGSVRVSPSFFTTDTEIDAFVDAVKEILLMTN